MVLEPTRSESLVFLTRYHAYAYPIGCIRYDIIPMISNSMGMCIALYVADCAARKGKRLNPVLHYNFSARLAFYRPDPIRFYNERERGWGDIWLPVVV